MAIVAAVIGGSELTVLARMTLEVRRGLTHFPSLLPQKVSVTCSDPRDVDQLAKFADAARFFFRPDQDNRCVPDARTYLIRIELGERSRALTVADPINDKDLARLIRFVKALAAEREDQSPQR